MSFSRADDARENNLDFLRLCLAVLVIFSHGFLLTRGSYASDPFHIITRGQTNGGALAVSGFFVISGYLITMSWLRCDGAGDYLRRRVLRIVPAFVAATAFCVFVVAPVAAEPGYLASLNPATIAARMATLREPVLPPVFAENPIANSVNGSMWTILPEFACYIAIAALGAAGALRHRALVLALFVASLAAYGAMTYQPQLLESTPLRLVAPSVEGNPRLFVSFLAGACAYLYRRELPWTRPAFAAALAVIVVTAATGGLRLALPIFGAYAILCAGFAPMPALHGFARHRDLSYGVYLYAFPVQQLLILWGAAWITPYTLFPPALAATLALAAVSWYAVERPALRLKARRTFAPIAPGRVLPAVRALALERGSLKRRSPRRGRAA